MMTGFLMISLMSAAVIGTGTNSDGAGSMTLASDSFKHEEYLSKDYTCDGKDMSPELHWTYAGKAESYAVTCEDPGAPGGTFVHWVIYNIPGSVRRLQQKFPKSAGSAGSLQGINDFGETGYNGPCPPRGSVHSYIFTVYALNTKIGGSGITLSEFKKLIKGHVLGSASITGLYRR